MANAQYALPDLNQVPHHRALEELSQIISKQTRRQDVGFFRVVIAYYLSVVASSMRTKLVSRNKNKEVPVNCYTITLAPSGFGKGYSTYIMENEVLKNFRDTFRDHVMDSQAELQMWKLAGKRAVLNQTEEQVEYDGLARELSNCGAYPFTFDGASEPAIKQIRQMLLIAGSGSINFQVDEIGLNLEKSLEAMRVYLELYDQGMVKPKLTKNSAENKRTSEIEGKTPANMLMFGTASKLLDGGNTEKAFYSLLETGYARRCLFAWGKFMENETAIDEDNLDHVIDSIYANQTDTQNEALMTKWSTHLASLADLDKFNWSIDVSDDLSKRLLYYQIFCEKRCRAMPEHEEIRKAEMEHRYYKAYKLAGVYAFIDEAISLTEDHLYQAIKLVEESGEAFQALLSREATYVKLARYLATVGREVTHPDLMEALPFFKGSTPARTEMITMATAWGYRQHIMVRKNFVDGIEFFTGETLKETKLDEITLSWSDDFAHNYQTEKAPFFDMENLVKAPNLHWANHGFDDGHRCDDKAIPGFNMVVLDIDDSASLNLVHDLLSEYVFMTYTTKRHTPDENRFRLLLPVNYELKLDQEDYRTFVNNLTDWLPFKVTDDCGNQRSKKWLTNSNGTIYFNREGRLMDALPFVPKTSKNEFYKDQIGQLKSYDSLERWFAQRFSEGSRNDHMIKFALSLVDFGHSYPEIESRVLAFNAKLANGLSAAELRSTVLVTVAKKLQARP